MIKKMIKKWLKKIMPRRKKNNKILFESNGFYDNGYVLFNYVRKNYKEYDCWFYTAYKNRKITPKDIRKKTIFYYSKKFSFARVKTFFNLYTFSGYFFSQECIPEVDSDRLKVFMPHGFSYKMVKWYAQSYVSRSSHCIVNSSFFAEKFQEITGNNHCQYVILERPTYDLFFREDVNLKEKLNIPASSKIILNMTTFRRTMTGGINENIFPIDIDFNSLNETLKEENLYYLIKLHHMFDETDLSVFGEYSNIVFLKNKDIFAWGLEPTSLMKYADAMITDYSSSGTDYLLFNRPIGYLIPDIKEYADNPLDGLLWGEDTVNYMPGPHLYNEDDIISFIEEVSNGVDNYALKRRETAKLFHNSSELKEGYCKAIAEYFLEKKN